MAMIDEAGRTALKHYLTSCTVVITSETPEFEHGTGVVVRYKNQTYILTAAHVLEGEPSDEKLLITGRPDSALVEVPQHELSGAFLAGTHGPIKLSRGIRIPISKRLAGKGLKDIAALKVQDVEKHLPHTASHYLPGHGPIDTSEGKPVIVCGFPGKLAIHASHRATSQSIAAVVPYYALQTISKTPNQLDPSVDFVTDFDANDTCDPKGMSGGGAWAIPKTKDGELWSPHQTQLVGIQSGVDRERQLLGLVSIERVLDLLSND